jgi:hypothetical protein
MNQTSMTQPSTGKALAPNFHISIGETLIDKLISQLREIEKKIDHVRMGYMVIILSIFIYY